MAESTKHGKPCTIPDCEAPIIGRGFCSTHYSRLRRTGTTDKRVRSPEELEAARERRREYMRTWKQAEYVANREQVLARRKVWLAKNVDRMKLYDARRIRNRRALQAAGLPFSVDQLAGKIAYWGGKCWVCMAPYQHIDHVKPLSKSGPHMLANLRPICQSCNSRKGARWPVPTGKPAKD